MRGALIGTVGALLVAVRNCNGDAGLGVNALRRAVASETRKGHLSSPDHGLDQRVGRAARTINRTTPMQNVMSAPRSSPDEFGPVLGSALPLDGAAVVAEVAGPIATFVVVVNDAIVVLVVGDTLVVVVDDGAAVVVVLLVLVVVDVVLVVVGVTSSRSAVNDEMLSIGIASIPSRLTVAVLSNVTWLTSGGSSTVTS